MKKPIFKQMGFYLSLLALAMVIAVPPPVATAQSAPLVVPAETEQRYLTRPQILKGLRETEAEGLWELVVSTDSENWTRSGILQELMRFEIAEPEKNSFSSEDALGRCALLGALTPDDGGEIRYVAGISPSVDAGAFRRFFPVLVSPDVSIAHDMAQTMAKVSNGGPWGVEAAVPSEKSGAACIAACTAAYVARVALCSGVAAACVIVVEAAKDTCDTTCLTKPPEQQEACLNNCEDTEIGGLAVCAGAFLVCQQTAATARGVCSSGCIGGGGGPPPV